MNDQLMALLGFGSGLGNYQNTGAPSGGYGGLFQPPSPYNSFTPQGQQPAPPGYGYLGSQIGYPAGGTDPNTYSLHPLPPQTQGAADNKQPQAGQGGGIQTPAAPPSPFNQAQQNYIQGQGKLPGAFGGGALDQAQQNFFNAKGYLPGGVQGDNIGKQYYKPSQPPATAQPATLAGNNKG